MLESGRTVALKMSRVSTRVKRPILQHESHILQLLKGHASISAVYAYGPNTGIAEQQKKNGPGTGLMLKTVIRIMDHVAGEMRIRASEVTEPDTQLAGLEHIHSLGIVNQNIKPENLLYGLDDSTIKIINFEISKPISHGPPSKYDPLKDRKTIMWSLYWASLNSNNGVDLAPREDLESLAYIALFLIRGHFPWKPRPRLESQLRSQEIIWIMKSSCSGKDLSSGFPVEVGDLLDYSCPLDFNQLPDYETSRRIFAGLTEGISDGPLDWSPCDSQTTTCVSDERQLNIPGLDEDDDPDDDDYAFVGENSNFEMDISMWERQREWDEDLSLPIEREVYLDSCTPPIVQVRR
ncbi:kinase-like protein [Armillaria solidipes]|uniref:Kinase-like protein n=1 Tax=Armillaria solidipes TaxID=1076256 RepID=A0A2H3B327_9AGAR|nr:kinase-like protein [Armillaria solidipes]